jgi:hypothetical protein
MKDFVQNHWELVLPMRKIPARAFVTIFVVLGPVLAWAEGSPRYCQVIPAPNSTADVVHVQQEGLGARCSLKALIENVISQGDPAKGEFETSTDYRTRIQKVMALHVFQDTLLSGQFGLVLQIDPLSVTYDADKQGFIASLASLSDQVEQYVSNSSDVINGGDDASFYYIEFSRNTTKQFYEAENRFGIKATVMKEIGDVWALHLSPQPPLADLPLPKPPLLLVPPAEAKAVKGLLAMVFVGAATSPPVTTSYIRTDVTLLTSVEHVLDIHRLGFHPTIAFITRLDTGQILAKANFDSRGRGMFRPKAANDTRRSSQKL